jgi:putative ABC transport system substrate-binding protein
VGTVAWKSTEGDHPSSRQLTHPLVARGVADHSAFRTERWDRMRRLVQNRAGAAKNLAVQLQSEEVRDPGGIDGAFASMSAGRVDGLVVVVDPLTVRYRGRIAELAAKNRLPSMYGFREFADAGGLMTYGANVADLCRRAAAYVDKILKGAKPADLPVEQPTTFEFVINMKTAKTLGLTIPQSILVRADEIIQ